MRKKQEINVIMHYPRTHLGWMSWMKRIIYSDPDFVYEYIKKLKVSQKERDELLKLARSQAEIFHSHELDFYRRKPWSQGDDHD